MQKHCLGAPGDWEQMSVVFALWHSLSSLVTVSQAADCSSIGPLTVELCCPVAHIANAVDLRWLWQVSQLCWGRWGRMEQRQGYTSRPADLQEANVDLHEIHCVSKKVPSIILSVTLSNLHRFSKFLHSCKAYEICYKTHTTVPTSP